VNQMGLRQRIAVSKVTEPFDSSRARHSTATARYAINATMTGPHAVNRMLPSA